MEMNFIHLKALNFFLIAYNYNGTNSFGRVITNVEAERASVINKCHCCTIQFLSCFVIEFHAHRHINCGVDLCK